MVLSLMLISILIPQNTDNKEHLQPHYIPYLLSKGSIKPVPITLISTMSDSDSDDGGRGRGTYTSTSLLERTETALRLFREGRVSGSKVIVQVGDGVWWTGLDSFTLLNNDSLFLGPRSLFLSIA